MTEALEPPSPELDQLHRELEAIRSDARLLFAGLTDSHMTWRPAPALWSVLDCIVHLNVTNGHYVERFERAITRAREKGLLGKPPYRADRLGLWFAGFLEPPVKTRVKAPGKFRPLPGVTPERARAEFFDWQGRIEDCVRRSDGLDLYRVRVASPVFPILHFSLGQAFRGVTAHERRHLWQARRVLADPACPTA